MASFLDQEVETYERLKSQLLASAEGQYALIHQNRLLGTYHNEKDAVAEGYRQLGNVPFLVQEIVVTEVSASIANGNAGL